jgi:hypothetical protein
MEHNYTGYVIFGLWGADGLKTRDLSYVCTYNGGKMKLAAIIRDDDNNSWTSTRGGP